MKIDLSCPIEVRGYTLTCSEQNTTACVRLYNLTPRRITSFEAVARWYSREEEKNIVCPFSMENLQAVGESMFQITLENRRLPSATEVAILFNTVRFHDNDSEWHAGNGPFAEMQPLPPLSIDQLEALKLAAGSDAVCIPRQDSLTWTCVCGRINAAETSSCARCHRDSVEALRHTSESIQSAQERHSAPDDEPYPLPLQQGFHRRRGRLMRRTLLMTLAVLAFTVFFAFQESPRYTAPVETASVLTRAGE